MIYAAAECRQRLYYIFALALLIPLFCVLPQTTQAQFYLNQTSSLEGIERLLLITEFSGDAEQIESIDPNSLRRDLSRHLLSAGTGIQLISEQAWAREKGAPYLYVNVNGIKSELGFYVYRLQVALYQEVNLVREPDKSSIVPTWEAAELGFAGENRIESIRADITRLLDNFIQEFKTANQATE
jgi:hypothetical protein